MLARVVLVASCVVVVLCVHAAQVADDPPMPSTSAAAAADDADPLPPPARIRRCRYQCRFCSSTFRIPTRVQLGLYDLPYLRVCTEVPCLKQLWELDESVEVPQPERTIGTWPLPPTPILPASSHPAAYTYPRLTGAFVTGVLWQLRRGRPIDADRTMTLLDHAANLINTEQNVVKINVNAEDRVQIVGNIHGQLQDLWTIWDVSGLPRLSNRYIFNGGIVNEGDDSVQCVLSLLAIKLYLPQAVYLLRGSDESLEMFCSGRFLQEIAEKYPDRTADVVHHFRQVLHRLPMAALVSKDPAKPKVFVVHGGLPRRTDITMRDIAARRFSSSAKGVFTRALIWSSPGAAEIPGADPDVLEFGPDVTRAFLRRHNCKLIVRAHDFAPDGYLFDHDQRVLTVFSAPNFRNQGNLGAVLWLYGDDLDVKICRFRAATPMFGHATWLNMYSVGLQASGDTLRGAASRPSPACVTFRQLRCRFCARAMRAPSITLRDRRDVSRLDVCDRDLCQEKSRLADMVVERPEPPGLRFIWPIEEGSLTADFVLGLIELFRHGTFSYSTFLPVFAYMRLIQLAAIKFSRERNAVEIDVGATETVTVCGSIHGQYHDLINLWEMNGYPSQQCRYVFNGDFLGRNALDSDKPNFSVETVLTLLAWKLVDPESIYLIRGRNEASVVQDGFGASDSTTAAVAAAFQAQVRKCFHKQGDVVFHMFSQAFSKLPLAAVLAAADPRQPKVMVVPGGLPCHDALRIPDLQSRVIRDAQPAAESFAQQVMSDLIWAEPRPYDDGPDDGGFGPQITQTFAARNHVKLVVRSRDAVRDGFRFDHDGYLATVFSAPNYEAFDVLAAYLRFNRDLDAEVCRFRRMVRDRVYCSDAVWIHASTRFKRRLCAVCRTSLADKQDWLDYEGASCPVCRRFGKRPVIASDAVPDQEPTPSEPPAPPSPASIRLKAASDRLDAWLRDRPDPDDEYRITSPEEVLAILGGGRRPARVAL